MSTQDMQPNGSSSDVSEGVVILNYEDLINPETDLSNLIEKAYGFNGLGILAVKGVPNFVEKRRKLLPLSHKFANFPEEIKKKTEHADSFYSFGWSHGKEKFEGKPDYSKGSYYNNPTENRPFEDEELIKKYPSFAHPNIWPTQDLPELEHAFLDLGRLIVDVGLLVAKHCDKFAHKQNADYPSSKLHDIIANSKTNKARLLHYFPLTAEQLKASSNNEEEATSSWCGWHNDHGSLTGLTPAMYMDLEGNEVSNPDPKSGLYIRSRSGQLIKAAVPSDHIIYQIGETATIQSGGVLQATPHCVRGALGEQSAGISRETFAVFMEPMWMEPLAAPHSDQSSVSLEAVLDNIVRGSGSKNLPPKVPTLASRWQNGITFEEFTNNTLKSYY